MRRYIAFLRGINISGKNKVPMADLKVCFEELSFADVKTYLNSGNVAFSSEQDDIDSITDQLEQMIKDTFCIHSPVFVILQKELEDVLNHAPEWWGNDILRDESITPTLDIVASVFQVIMVVSLCLIANGDYHKSKNRKWMISIIVSIVVYFLGWCMYYGQIVNPVVIMILCVAPCVTFITLSINKKNGVAFVSATVFMICHVLYGLLNFIC